MSMFFPEHLRRVYSTALVPGRDFDPLLVDRLLVVESGGRLNEWITLRNESGSGDQSEEGRRQARVEAARAEIELSKAARSAFGLGPDAATATCLEVLYEFLGWMEGKGGRAESSSRRYDSCPAA